MHPYPLVNNTERWQALRDSCPYPFTILGQNEVWAGDRSVTNNKLFFYMKCARPICCLPLGELASDALVPNLCHFSYATSQTH